jgi:Domain of unknown function (DUF6794)
MIEQEFKTNPIPTIDGIVDDIITKLSPEDKAYIANGTLRDAQMMHHGFGTWIRNTYGLWHDNPLTERWRTDKSSHDIRDGVDYSEDHPDQMSGHIIEALWRRLNKV